MESKNFSNQLYLEANKNYSLEDNIAFAVQWYMYTWQLKNPDADIAKRTRVFNRAKSRITKELTAASK